MDKKAALAILLENSLIIPDKVKKQLLLKLPSLSSVQIDALGTLLAREREYMLTHKETIIKRTKLLVETLELVT